MSKKWINFAQLNLDKYVKLSIIALALVGIYYFAIVLPSKNTQQIQNQQLQSQTKLVADQLAMKQKCNEAGAAFAKSQNAGIVNSIFVYSSTLNTCLAYLEDELPSTNKDLGLVVGNIYDVFSNSQMLHQGCTYSISSQTFLSCQVDNSAFISKANSLMGQSVCGGLFDLCEVGKDVPTKR